jgi:hypothetical protein
MKTQSQQKPKKHLHGHLNDAFGKQKVNIPHLSTNARKGN